MMNIEIEQSTILNQSLQISNNNIFEITKTKNKRNSSNADDSKILQMAKSFNEKHWKEISDNFSNKNNLQFSKFKNAKEGVIKGTWSKEEDEQILELVSHFGKSWSKISKFLNSRNGKQIRDRYINVLDPAIKKGKFSEEEDKMLIELYYKYGPKWSTISKYFPDRTADMVKNRFHSSIKRVLKRGDMLLSDRVNTDIMVNLIALNLFIKKKIF